MVCILDVWRFIFRKCLPLKRAALVFNYIRIHLRKSHGQCISKNMALSITTQSNISSRIIHQLLILISFNEKISSGEALPFSTALQTLLLYLMLEYSISIFHPIYFIKMNNFRANNIGGSYYEHNKLGYSSVSKQQGYSHRNPGFNEDHNFGELEFMLENERKKFREAKEKFESDLDNERKLRIEFENKLIKLKDEFSRKEVQISEMEFRINNLLHQNQDVLVENERLRSELARLEEVYGGKVHELESQLAMEGRNFDEVTSQYNSEFEKFKKEGQDYVEQLTFDFERKLKNAEERAKQAELAKRDLTMENKKLNDIIISNKLNFDEEIRDLRNKAREEELKKHQHIMKSHEQKVRVMDESKELLARKNQELQRALQERERALQEIEADRNEEVSRLRGDNSDLEHKLNQLNFLVNKYKGELAEKDSLLGRSHQDNDHEVGALRQQVELKKQENMQMSSTIRDLRMQLKEAESEWERRRREMVDRCNILDAESRKYKEEYHRICEVLKSKINDTINNVSYKK